MPPKKVAKATTATAPVANSSKKAQTKPSRATSKAAASDVAPVTKESKSTAAKRKASESVASEPNGKRAKSAPANTSKPVSRKADGAKKPSAKTAAKAPAPKAASKEPTTKTAVKANTKKVAVGKKVKANEDGEDEVAPTKVAPKKATAPRKIAVPKKPKAVKKAGPVLNTIPTKRLDIYVFGEGTAGELGLGSGKHDGKKPVDVKRPRLNHRLAADTVGVVALDAGGMHCAALTYDNKILTWGVNDQGALGRETKVEGKMKEIKVGGNADSESDSDDDDDDGLNPSEAEPRQVDPTYFAEGTKFAQLVCSDSATFVLTDDGQVYGWGTFRGNDGILGFTKDVKVQTTPVLIPELKKITAISNGSNHILALNDKGKVFAWGAGEQNQLARRVVSRTATGALIPREFGLQRKKIVRIGCGDYHSFAVDKDGNVYSWGLNSFGQTGISKDEDDENGTIATPTLVESLTKVPIKQIDGGAHHTIAVTEDGKVLVWGRIDNNQGGMEIDDFNRDDVFFDENDKPRFLLKPVQIPDIIGDFVSSGADHCLVVAKDGKAYSWGFSANYQTGQGIIDDVTEATLIDNSAIRGKKLCWAGAGGQYSALAGVSEDVAMTNGI